MEFKEEQTKEGYRLAPYLLRLSATAVDAALALVLLLLLYFVSFPNGHYGTIGDALGIPTELASLRQYQVASGLVVQSESGALSDVASSSYEDYEKAIQYYYFTYNASDNSLNPNPEAYSIGDYNVAVLELPSSSDLLNNSTYFTFDTTNGKSDANKIGVLKASLFVDGQLTDTAKASLLTYFQNKYKKTQDLLLSETYYKNADEAYAGHVELLEALCAFVPFLVFYFAIPMFSSGSRTLGKKWMKLAVINSDGTPLAKWHLILRALPFLLSVGLAIFFNDILISLSLLLLVFLVSTGLASFSPKRRALHDYLAQSVVVREEDAYIGLTENEPISEGKSDAQDR